MINLEGFDRPKIQLIQNRGNKIRGKINVISKQINLLNAAYRFLTSNLLKMILSPQRPGEFKKIRALFPIFCIRTLILYKT
jgi:hypothetical protein